MSFDQFVDKIFWLVTVAVCGYGVRSVTELNERVAVVIEHMALYEKYTDNRLNTQDKRLENLEAPKKK